MTRILPDPITHITEFGPASPGYGGADGLWHGDCGETALAVAMGAARGFVVTSDIINQITVAMVEQGLTVDRNGASNMQGLATYARNNGYSIIYERDYQGDVWDENEWHQLLLDHAGIHPIVLNLARGGANVDAETGVGAEQGVQYHVIAVLGMQDDGYLCNDGDNPQSNDRFQIYNLDSLRSAMPCGMIILDMQRDQHADPVPTQPEAHPMAAFDGWEPQGDGMLGPESPLDHKRYLSRGGILAFIQAQGFDEPPITDIIEMPDGSYLQTFLTRQVAYRGETAGWNWIGVDWVQKEQQITAMQQQLAAKDAQIGALQGELDKLKSTVTPTDAPAPVTTPAPEPAPSLTADDAKRIAVEVVKTALTSGIASLG